MAATVSGIAELVNRLEKFDKDVSKQLKKEMRSASLSLVRESKSAYPGNVALSNWGAWTDPVRGRSVPYVGKTVRSAIKLETTRKRVRAATVAFGYSAQQMNPAGAILAFAGLSSGGVFNDNIVSKYRRASKAPRFMAAAYYKVVPEVAQKIEKSIQDAMRKVGQ